MTIADIARPRPLLGVFLICPRAMCPKMAAIKLNHSNDKTKAMVESVFLDLPAASFFPKIFPLLSFDQCTFILDS